MPDFENFFSDLCAKCGITISNKDTYKIKEVLLQYPRLLPLAQFKTFVGLLLHEKKLVTFLQNENIIQHFEDVDKSKDFWYFEISDSNIRVSLITADVPTFYTSSIWGEHKIFK